MPNIDLVAIAKMALKLLMFVVLLGVIGTFINLLMGYIPPLNLSGCIGKFVNMFGFILGLKLMLSIIVYGFGVKFAISYFSSYLN